MKNLKTFVGLVLVLFTLSLFTSCNEDDVLPGEPMLWSYDIKTPESVKHIASAGGWTPAEYFSANGMEGDIVMTCENYDVLNPISGDSYTCDYGWATLRIEANQVKIHFPPSTSEPPDAHKKIQISAKDGKRTSRTIISLSRTFREELSK